MRGMAAVTAIGIACAVGLFSAVGAVEAGKDGVAALDRKVEFNIAPQQLPVGVITALIGVPIFLLQLHQLRRR